MQRTCFINYCFYLIYFTLSVGVVRQSLTNINATFMQDIFNLAKTQRVTHVTHNR